MPYKFAATQLCLILMPVDQQFDALSMLTAVGWVIIIDVSQQILEYVKQKAHG